LSGQLSVRREQTPVCKEWERPPWHETQPATRGVGEKRLFLLILGLALIAQAAPLSVSEVLTNPDRFHGQPATISATMTNLRESVSGRGTRSYTFDFGDGNQTILVRSFAKPPCRSGAATVEGTFEKVTRGSRVTHEITARSVRCLR